MRVCKRALLPLPGWRTGLPFRQISHIRGAPVVSRRWGPHRPSAVKKPGVPYVATFRTTDDSGSEMVLMYSCSATSLMAHMSALAADQSHPRRVELRVLRVCIRALLRPGWRTCLHKFGISRYAAPLDAAGLRHVVSHRVMLSLFLLPL